MIAILIPVYNIGREYLARCLDSILNQTYDNFEVCLVDDCSTKKETLDTLKEYSEIDPRIHVSYHKKNKHIYQKLFFGIYVSPITNFCLNLSL